MNEQEPERDQKPGFLSILASTFAAAVGIQSSKNRERDFKHGNLKVFIVAGLLFTAFFIGSVVLVVRLILNEAGM